MRYLVLFFYILFFAACKGQGKDKLETKEIILNNLVQDSIITIIENQKDTLCILREIEVFRNDNNDTIILGYSIVPPRFIGKIWFIQDNLNQSSAVYIDKKNGLDLNSQTSFSKLFVIGLMNQKYEKGFSTIGLRLKVKALTN